MDDLLSRYGQRYSMTFTARLGEGKDGHVFQTNQRTAVKFLGLREHYNREVRAYRILADLALDEIDGHQIPHLIRTDDSMTAIEMSVVRPPFIVDIVSAHTDDQVEWFGF